VFDRYKALFDKAKKPFVGDASLPADPDHGKLYDYDKNETKPFDNRGEQLIYFVTSGSLGYLSNGKYFDISGSSISEDEYNRIIVTLGIEGEVGSQGSLHADDYWRLQGERGD